MTGARLTRNAAGAARPARTPAQVLASVRWLGAMDAPVIELLAAQSRIVQLGVGQTLQRRGERIENFTVVVEGRVEFSTANALGKRLVVGYIGRNHAISLVPLLDGKGSMHDVTAMEPVTLLVVPRTVFVAAIREQPALADAVIAQLCRRQRMTYGYIADSALLPAPARIARLLLSLNSAARYESGDDAAPIDLPQESIAEMAALSRQRLNSELKQMERDGLLKIAYARIEVTDEPALRRLAGF